MAEPLAVPLVLPTAIVDEHARVQQNETRKLWFVKGGSVFGARMLPSKISADTRSTEKSKRSERCLFNALGRDAQLTYMARHTHPDIGNDSDNCAGANAIGLSYLDLRLSIVARHGIRMTGGIVELDPRKELDVIVTDFTPKDSFLPKNAVVGYAPRNPLATTIPSREIGEQYAQTLHIQTIVAQAAPAMSSSTASRNNDASCSACRQHGKTKWT